MATISLTYKTTKIDIGYKLEFAVTAQTGLPDVNIFAIQVNPLTSSGQASSQFSHVCTMIDMQTYPTALDLDIPYYRVNQLQLIIPSTYLYQSTLQAILAESKQLVNQYNSLASTQGQEHQVVIS